MASGFVLQSPLGQALSQAVQAKLAESAFAQGGGADPATLTEYTLLMLENNKTEGQIASEIATDLLDLNPNSPDVKQFVRWLFHQVNVTRAELDGTAAPPLFVEIASATSGAAPDVMSDGAAQPAAVSAIEPMDLTESAGQGAQVGADDAATAAIAVTEMPSQDAAASLAIPTGPKAMRGGGSQNPRDKRLSSRGADRSSEEAALHRIKGTPGAGRINTHALRDAPTGPRGLRGGRGMGAMDAMAGMPGMNDMAMNSMGGMLQMPMSPMAAGGMSPMLNTQQQMAMFQMYEQQAHMMQQLFSGPQSFADQQQQLSFGNRTNRGGSGRGNGRANGRSHGSTNGPRSLFERAKPGPARPQLSTMAASAKEGQDAAMIDVSPSSDKDATTPMDVENARPDPSRTLCRFNLSCTKPDCLFAHQSPAAPADAAVDLNDVCSYGAACTNNRCSAKHPSPAQRNQHKATTDCMFFPNCRDPLHCPYRHPNMPPCRNGADCTTPNCKFAHSKVMCKFNPCTNRFCAFKHADGQKKAYVWKAPDQNGHAEPKGHVSERRFVDESAGEEVVLPGRASNEAEGEPIAA